ncbi:GGDEF domain-containing protein [Photobacterium leiognathi]|uniref:GGDEF domain-containing protein n=1 Tax=Photobacterium leiognathi TaxID=553611 RepID=UPI002980E92F|nr:GGDEF domain-containing protein [Photobacterium leiognathi]
MTTLIKSHQLQPTNFAYIELSENTLKKQLALLFPFSGAICAVIAFTYFVSNAEYYFTFVGVVGMLLCYALAILNRSAISSKVLFWIFLVATTLVCASGFYFDGARHISNTIGLTIPLLCFFALRIKTAGWYSLIFGFIYIVLSISEITNKHLQISSALQNICAYSIIFVMAFLLSRHRYDAIKQVKRTTTHDYLTGLLNREGFVPLYLNESSRCQRYRRDISMLLLDIDNLREINDRFGLDAGDKTIMMLAKCLNEHCGDKAKIARLSCQEFCILLPDADIQKAEFMAIQLRNEVAKWSLELETGHRINITISVGITAVEYQDFRYDYIKAESALMRAKRWGYNQIATNE